jgi:hypothetical protein
MIAECYRGGVVVGTCLFLAFYRMEFIVIIIIVWFRERIYESNSFNKLTSLRITSSNLV